MKVAAWLSANEEERALVDAMLDVEWEGREADIVLSFWPRQEMRRMGISWDDVNVGHLQLTTAGANHAGWSNLPAPIQVGVTPGATGPYIAEYVLAGLLHWTRRLGELTADIRRGVFATGAPVRSMKGLNVGLLGFGGIGQECAKLLKQMGCNVRAVNRRGESDQAHVVDQLLPWTERMELAAWADALVVAVPLLHDTKGVVDAAMLEALGDGCLVNVARGPVVDEEALFAWLSRTGFAVLDVWWAYPKEGHPFTKPFHTLPNLVMTPHNSPNVPGFRLTMIEAACRHVQHFLQTGSLRHAVERSAYSDEGDGR